MRAEGWEALLHEHLKQGYRDGFEWGRNDCALWCAEWVWKATGRDLGLDWRNRYRTERGAARLMVRRHFKTVADIASEYLVEIPVANARRGDIVLHPDGPLGICAGRLSQFLTEDATTAMDTLACVRAWGVD